MAFRTIVYSFDISPALRFEFEIRFFAAIGTQVDGPEIFFLDDPFTEFVNVVTFAALNDIIRLC